MVVVPLIYGIPLDLDLHNHPNFWMEEGARREKEYEERVSAQRQSHFLYLFAKKHIILLAYMQVLLDLRASS